MKQLINDIRNDWGYFSLGLLVFPFFMAGVLVGAFAIIISIGGQ